MEVAFEEGTQNFGQTFFSSSHVVELVLSFPQMNRPLALHSLIHVQNPKLQTRSQKEDVY